MFPRNWYISKTSSANLPNIFTIARQVAYITTRTSRKKYHKDTIYLDRTSLNLVSSELIFLVNNLHSYYNYTFIYYNYTIIIILIARANTICRIIFEKYSERKSISSIFNLNLKNLHTNTFCKFPIYLAFIYKNNKRATSFLMRIQIDPLCPEPPLSE